MKRLKVPVIVIFLGILAFSACEKDDICVDNDTPLVIVRFYDLEDTTELKEVPGLVVRGIGDTDLLDTLAFEESNPIAIPLRVDANTTSFTLSRTLTANGEAEVDTLVFNYSPTEVFASRACGYVVNYDSVAVATAQEPEDSLWIKDITLETRSITISDTTHVKIFH